MKYPKIILESGLRVKINHTVHSRQTLPRYPGHLFLDQRKPNVVGVILGSVPRTDGAIYWIRHEDGTLGPYSYSEFEIEPQ